MEISTAVVLGLGSSGESVSRLLARHGTVVRALDEASGDAIACRAQKLREEGIAVEFGDIDSSAFAFGKDPAVLCVVSPGVPAGSRLITEAERLGIPILPELDVGYNYAKCPLIAVTGSNGKSTLVKLLDDALRLLGMRSAPCGNYGEPLSSAVERGAWERLVVEVSSFQMERSELFAPQTGVLLNLSQNHLDRHGDMKVYEGLKARMFAKMPEDGIAIVNEQQADLVRGANSKVRMVTLGNDNSADYSYASGTVSGPGVQINVEGTFADNAVMGLTASAALAVINENGWDTGALEEAIRGFEPLEFRMQKVGELRGVTFINNSKATTLSAVEASLLMTSAPVRLICGGILKEKNLAFIEKMLVNRVSSAYVYGQAGMALSGAWSASVKCLVFEDLRTAVLKAFEDAESGDIVLLSPGCSSFDQFKSFADRGREFNSVVEELRRSSG